jgi:hypothetical protein
MRNSSTTTISSADLSASLQIVEIKPGLKFTKAVLKELLPDVETTLFFGKVFELDYDQLSALLRITVNTDLMHELQWGAHSTELQSYIVDELDLPADVDKGEIVFKPTPPKGEILPELWSAMSVEVAQSIKDVAAKLEHVVGLMPGKQGAMLFKSMMTMNKRRPTIGDFKALIHHAPAKENLIVFDVSGSMSEPTVRKIVDDVVALSYTANAHLAIVSNTCTHWEPGEFDSRVVLEAAEFGGTHYEMLAPLFDRDWGVVVTIADYDSSYSAKEYLRNQCTGSIEQLLDVSLVNTPTYLADCLGQLAKEVRPILVADTHYVLDQ